ncbi:pyrroloquinoline quinone biosynthesis protein PqqC [Bacillus sp. MUM 116]|uniref:pyrroloquinoline-quinone synthase PqqC n=1 Tax=Bacillus sp. MUM 116 TaxID=1678002 RepID=UPI0008F5ED76|nr:pyrroloquinoline-quinone synthase PqqC [Bacillus sp. MUM 116]OIK15907.1 pyrroloquinoline quinone biosynthesis protein PqqC [Bacillus sp. MUM 116]
MLEKGGAVSREKKPDQKGKELWKKDEFTERLKDVGRSFYHDKHPFHVAMHQGKLSRDQIRGWVTNRYYYQKSVPIKDAAILSNLPSRELRREWIQRIIDHDGTHGVEGGIEAWLGLGEAVGLTREEILREDYVVPGVRFSVDAYVNFARTKPWIEAVASSLTELFSPDLISKRMKVLERLYPWIDSRGFEYFQNRLTQAPLDSDCALKLVLTYCQSPEEQQRAVDALRFKCDVLWAQLDAIEKAYSSKA